ncbi:metallophosphoesterase [Luteimonas sp. A611]
MRNPRNGRNATIRPMQAQLASTRLFNENYFAFLAALDDAIARGARLVVLPGDFSDDGQPVHMRGLVRILDAYAARHGVAFFAAPGNHDPVRPYDQAGGDDFLGTDPLTGEIGVAQPVHSRGGSEACRTSYAGPWARIGAAWCTEEIRSLGHAGITAMLARHGFMPQPQYLYYETPYSHYAHADYDHATALAQAGWERRRHVVCGEAAAPGAAGGRRACRMVADASYLVEPVSGLWLVSLDAGIHVPTGRGRDDFTGSGNQGHDAMLAHRPHVIAWLADVVARGEALGKQVLAFSHFPMAEFYNDASDDIAALFGDRAMQLARRPRQDTTAALAATGLRLHVGGHMHLNNLAVHRGGSRVLFNVQAPSLAAYVPAYTLMTLDGSERAEVRTVRLDDVPRFDELFDLYRAEHARGQAQWDVSILEATSYRDFTRRYLDELVRLRLLDEDWPCEMRELVRSPLSGADLLVWSQLRTTVTLGQLAAAGTRGGLTPAFFDCLYDAGDQGAPAADFAADLAMATLQARALAAAEGMRLEHFAQWTALELATDFFRLAKAGDLAFADIPAARAAQYRLLARVLAPSSVQLRMEAGRPSNANTPDELFQARFRPLMALLLTLAAGERTAHVRLDLASGEVTDLSGQPAPL